MFLFFSKLLPVFVYPLGLTCLLLIGTLVLIWRRPRLAALCSGLGLALLLTMSSGVVANGLLRSLEWQHLPQDPLPPADAIVVLGGAIRSAEYPRSWVEVAEAGDRPIHGARLFLDDKAPYLIMSGGRIPWYTGQGTVPESTDMAQIAMAMGVPADVILEDPSSLNTRENAVNVQQLLQEYNLNSVLLVTSALHMPRSLRIFQKLGINAIPAPTDFLTIQGPPLTPSGIRWLLESLPDADHLAQSSRVLKEYIGLIIYWLKGWV